MLRSHVSRPAANRAARAFLAIALVLSLLAPAAAEPRKLQVVASFSILADLVAQVGGARVSVTSLVGPDADAHGYSPSPEDARALAQADLIVVNGLGFEGWIDRLVKASGAKAAVVVATKDVPTTGGRHNHAGHNEREHGHTRAESAQGAADPHAWQSVANAKLYVAAIRDGLGAADPAHAAHYAANARDYADKLDALAAEIRAAIAAIPQERRRVITSHDSFGYFADAYGLRFVAPRGVSSASEPSPADIARIIRQIRKDRIPAVFLESIADPRLMQQIAREGGARIGGRIFSDALSTQDGPAPTYIAMMRANLRAFCEALR